MPPAKGVTGGIRFSVPPTVASSLAAVFLAPVFRLLGLSDQFRRDRRDFGVHATRRLAAPLPPSLDYF